MKRMHDSAYGLVRLSRFPLSLFGVIFGGLLAASGVLDVAAGIFPGPLVISAGGTTAPLRDALFSQREYLLLYYAEGLNLRKIGERLGVDPSTVSRTIKRGEARLRRCLRYGAAVLLDGGRGGVAP